MYLWIKSNFKPWFLLYHIKLKVYAYDNLKIKGTMKVEYDQKPTKLEEIFLSAKVSQF